MDPKEISLKSLTKRKILQQNIFRSINAYKSHVCIRAANICILIFLFKQNSAIRLHKMFQFLDGYKSEHTLQGFLHVGKDYAVFLRKPHSHDKYLTYELYEAKNVDTLSNLPRLLAISKVPVVYIKEQLTTFRDELYKAKYVDGNVVPGTQVKTLREWQISRALTAQNKENVAETHVLQTIVL